MQICVLFGGQHKHGNTATLLEHVLKGAKTVGYEFVQFNVASMDIKPCLGCMGCKKKQQGCVQKDDMEQIYEAIKSSEVLILASPMYWWNLAGPLKNVVDRFFALPFNAAMEQSAFAGKKLMLVMTSGQPREKDGREGLELILKKMCSFTGMEWAGCVTTGTNTRPASEQAEVCKAAYVMGVTL